MAVLHRATSNIPNRPLVKGQPLQVGDFDLPIVEGGQAPLAYGYEGLPQGLTVNPATQAVLGVPTQTGPFTIVQTVTDANGEQLVSKVIIHVVDEDGSTAGDPDPIPEEAPEGTVLAEQLQQQAPQFDNAFDAAADVVVRAGLSLQQAKQDLETARTDLAAHDLETAAELKRRLAELEAWKDDQRRQAEELGQKIDQNREAVRTAKADRLSNARTLRALLDTLIEEGEAEAAAEAEQDGRPSTDREAKDQ